MNINDAFLRIGLFLIILIIMITLEHCFPARKLAKTPNAPTLLMRLIGNWGLIIIASAITRLLLPLGLAGIALYCTALQWGLFNMIDLPAWLTIIVSLLVLDMLIYWQHRLFHKVPLLWRLHKVHHADPHVDSSTALRFHPIEIVISIGIKAIAVFLLGVPAIAVILFEVLLNGFAIFNHANIRLPKTVEAMTRHLLMTQILHRIHHSQVMRETNSNYGFSVIWWDKLFGSYADSASKADTEIEIGLIEYSHKQQNAHLWGLLVMPFKKNG